ncbi:hypothetical protein BDW02DRAFT_532103, partial [Decorospora gaudefroyi]
MVTTSHSSTVRGTLSNPKTQASKRSSEPTPNLGDATSLKPSNDDTKSLPSNDSAPPPGADNDDTLANGQDGKMGGGGKEELLPHSKKVRGTLGSDGGKKVDGSQLGDATSLKAEISSGASDGMGRETEREGHDK